MHLAKPPDEVNWNLELQTLKRSRDSIKRKLENLNK